jgi:NADH:ubiquinone oxidoreductase subunit E
MNKCKKKAIGESMLAEKYPDEIKAIFAKYPVKRSAVMPLLYLAQREAGYIQKESMQEIASMLELDVTEVAAIVGFYTMYHDEKAGKYRMQVCTDLPCALRGADAFMESPVRKHRHQSRRDHARWPDYARRSQMPGRL